MLLLLNRYKEEAMGVCKQKASMNELTNFLSNNACSIFKGQKVSLTAVLAQAEKTLIKRLDTEVSSHCINQ